MVTIVVGVGIGGAGKIGTSMCVSVCLWIAGGGEMKKGMRVRLCRVYSYDFFLP